MKKVIAILLIMVMALFAMTACDGGTTSDDDDTKKPNKQTEVQTEADTKDDEDDTKPQNKPVADNGDFDFSEMTVVDNDQCTIKITGIEIDDFWGFTLKTSLVNKSADKNYMFTIDNSAINGVKCETYFSSEVAPGKSANEDITFSEDDLEDSGIVNYTDIELAFRVYDSDDWSADDVANEVVNVYPYGEDKAEKYVREDKDTDKKIIDNENVTVIVTGSEVDDFWGYTVNLYLINKTDKNVMFTTDDVSVNDLMLDPYYGESVAPGKVAFSTMYWSEDDFEENNITDVESIEFIFRAYDYDDFMADDFVNEKITLNP